MAGLLIALNWLLPLLYLGLLVNYGVNFFMRSKEHQRNWLLLAVLGLHLLFLTLWAWMLGRPPLSNAYEILSALALCTAAVYTLLEFMGRERRTGVFVLLLVFLFQYTSSSFMAGTMASGQIIASAAQSGWARLHVLPALLAYTAMAIAAVYGLLHLLAQRNLKQHRLGLLFDRLPPLDLLGRMAWYALLSGFIFLSVTIFSSLLLFGHPRTPGQVDTLTARVIAKIVMGSAAWLIYAAALLGRLVWKWSSSRISGVALAGFVVVMVLFVLSAILS